jgi:hypothetical protein
MDRSDLLLVQSLIREAQTHSTSRRRLGLTSILWLLGFAALGQFIEMVGKDLRDALAYGVGLLCPLIPWRAWWWKPRHDHHCDSGFQR